MFLLSLPPPSLFSDFTLSFSSPAKLRRLPQVVPLLLTVSKHTAVPVGLQARGRRRSPRSGAPMSSWRQR